MGSLLSRFQTQLPRREELQEEVDRLRRHLQELRVPLVMAHNDVWGRNVIYHQPSGQYIPALDVTPTFRSAHPSTGDVTSTLRSVHPSTGDVTSSPQPQQMGLVRNCTDTIRKLVPLIPRTVEQFIIFACDGGADPPKLLIARRARTLQLGISEMSCLFCGWVFSRIFP